MTEGPFYDSESPLFDHATYRAEQTKQHRGAGLEWALGFCLLVLIVLVGALSYKIAEQKREAARISSDVYSNYRTYDSLLASETTRADQYKRLLAIAETDLARALDRAFKAEARRLAEIPLPISQWFVPETQDPVKQQAIDRHKIGCN